MHWGGDTKKVSFKALYDALNYRNNGIQKQNNVGKIRKYSGNYGIKALIQNIKVAENIKGELSLSSKEDRIMIFDSSLSDH